MEMIDVLKKLQEIESKSPEAKLALENARRMSGKPVEEAVQITVSGSDAVLHQILKLAGMIGAETMEEETLEDSHDEQRPYVTSPDEEILPFDTAVPAGTDMHMAKGTHPKVAGADNPMAVAKDYNLG